MEKNKIAKTTLKRIVTFLSKIEAKRIYLDKLMKKYKLYDKYIIYKIIKNLLRNLETIDFYLDYILKDYNRNVKKLERRVRNALRLYIYLKYFEGKDYDLSFMFKLRRKSFVSKVIKKIKNQKFELEIEDEQELLRIKNNIPKFIFRYLKEYDIEFDKIFKVCPTYLYITRDEEKVKEVLERNYGVYLKQIDENFYKIIGEEIYPFEDFNEIIGKYIFIDKSIYYLLKNIEEECIIELFPKNGIRTILLSQFGKEVYVYEKNNVEYLKRLFNRFNIEVKFINSIEKIDCLYLYQISSSFSGNLCKYPELKLFYQSKKYMYDLKERINSVIEFLYNNRNYINKILLISNSVINLDSEEIIKLLLKYYKPNKFSLGDFGYKKYNFYKNVGRIWDYKFDSLNLFYSYLIKK